MANYTSFFSLLAQLRVPFRQSQIEAFMSNDQWHLITTNVRRFRFYEIENALNSSSLPQQGLVIDKDSYFSFSQIQNIFVDHNLHFCCKREDGQQQQHSEDGGEMIIGSSKWQICSDGKDFEREERGPRNYGPARQLYSSPFLIVISSKEQQAAEHLELANYIANLHFIASSTFVQIVRDTELTEQVAKQYNLMLIGNPHTNEWIKKVVDMDKTKTKTKTAGKEEDIITDRLVTFGNGDGRTDIHSFKLGMCNYSEPGIGLLTTYPIIYGAHLPFHSFIHSISDCSSLFDVTTRTPTESADSRPVVVRLALILSGTDAAGLREAAMAWAAPTIPPMTRAPFTNLVPDYLVSSPLLRNKGTYTLRINTNSPRES